MLHSAVRFLRAGGLRNFNLRNTKTIHLDVVPEWLEQDFVKSLVARNGPGEEHRYRSLVRTLAQKFYTSAHALQHGGDNSEAISADRRYADHATAICDYSRPRWA